jgi:iron complex outermembrane receptor protein
LSIPRPHRRTIDRSFSRRLATAGACYLTLGGGPALAQGAREAATRPSEPSPSTADERPVPPTVVEQRQPDYPPEALPARLAGDVAVTVELDAAGMVTGTTLAKGVAPPLDRAAMAAAAGWRFQPARRAGQPVASRIQLVFHFEPPATSAASPPALAAAPPPRLLPAPSPPPPAEAAPPVALDVSVVGRRPPPSRGASDFQLRVGQLAEVPRANASELLKLAPGILLTNEGGEGHAEQVFMRGFDAREGQDLEFSVDGVPINESGNLHGNGYADTHFIIPELVESLRIVEGPFDPRQGNYAVAGSADYQLGLTQRGLSMQYTQGSFGTKRVLGLWGPPGESTHTFGGAEIYRTDGFGQNRDAERGTAMAQYEGRLGASGTYRLTAQAYGTHFHSAGVVREDDYQSGRIGFYDSYNVLLHPKVPEGGDASRASVALDLETRAGDVTFAEQVFVIKRDMRLLENFTGFLLDVQEPLQSVHDQRGDLLDLNVHETTVGSRGWARLAGTWWRQRQELELGYFARGDDAAGTQQRLEAATGVPYLTETNLASQIGDLGLYGDANLRLGRWLALRGGGRAELLTYDIHDNCASQTVAHPSPVNLPVDQSCLTQQSFGRPREPDQVTTTSGVSLLPRASLIVGPWRGLSLSGSWGKGVRSVDPSYAIANVQTPFASITAYEVGAAFTGQVRRNTLVARSVLFQTVVDKDLIFDQTEGRNVIGVGTTRTGWLGALRFSGRFFDEAANLTLVRARYNDDHTAVAYVPSAVLRSDTALFYDLPRLLAGHTLRGTLGAGITYVGPRPLPYGQVSGDIFTIDASASLAWGPYQLRLACTNLLDTQYRLGEYNYRSDFQSQSQPTLVPDRMFTAGAPRGVFATFAVTLGGA